MSESNPPIDLPEHPVSTAKHTLPSPPARILLSFVGGTLVWVTYFIFVYALNSLTCVWGWFLTPEGTYGPGLKLTQAITTLVALALLVYFAFVAYQEWRRGAGEIEGGIRASGAASDTVIAKTNESRNSLLGFVTLLVNVLYVLIVVISFFPIFMIPTCAR